ncbi:uncharacterized protein EDB91DRAFT_1257019 [Suillus paluster]|uniref:uncharacterized protein n=1 Tax=Suillus paluster TaxID=48578 RepID=UPI001B867E57|nr:uncharacterized protein EDB91DRAFT_1257019 [Suillus paluster]KAG1720355.1 hypothetical protein EDB91DRAFT_1257019 [Suillus paluster]
MGRPQLYKTEEAWLKAARTSNRKYYAKNKREIGLKMARNYRHKRDNTTKSKCRNLTSAPMTPKQSVSESSFTPPSPAAHENCDIYDIEDAQSNLVVISTKLEPLFIKMVQDFQDNREAVHETLERIHEYLQTLDDNLGHAAAAGVMCQSKAITMATEELWCYSATREMDKEMNPKFLRGGLLYQMITFSAEYFRLWDDTDHIVFFNNIYVRYFARWPDKERLFPGVTKLSGEQAIAVACSVRRKEKV